MREFKDVLYRPGDSERGEQAFVKCCKYFRTVTRHLSGWLGFQWLLSVHSRLPPTWLLRHSVGTPSSTGALFPTVSMDLRRDNDRRLGIIIRWSQSWEPTWLLSQHPHTGPFLVFALITCLFLLVDVHSASSQLCSQPPQEKSLQLFTFIFELSS